MLCSSSDSRPVGRALLGGLVLLLGGVLSAEPATPTTLLPTGDVYLDPAAPNGSCLAVDLLANEGALPALATEELTPGLYRAAFRLRVSHTVDRHVARMMFTISAVQDDEVLAERSFSLVAFETPNQPQDFDLDFTVLKRGPVTFQTRTEWQALKETKRPYLKVDVKPTDAMLDGDGEDEELMVLEHHLKELPWHLALDQITLAAPREVVAEGFTVDKLRYRPGETLKTVGEIVNHSNRARTVTAILEIVHDMDAAREAARQELALPPRGSAPLAMSTTIGDAFWGREARIRILEGETELSRSAEYFTVHDNPWAVAIGQYGLQLANYRAGADKDFKTFRNCERIARRQRGDHYGNVVEFVFWAEDDFGDLTPTENEYWCGQLRHPGGAEATRQLIKAFHATGIACSFYALYTAADGKAGYELYRKHPDWFRPGFYDISHLDRWDRSKELISWPRLGVRADTPEPYRHHAAEIIRSARDFGWDAIRYDTDMTVREMNSAQPHVAKYFPETKQIVNQALPKFQWGYNDGLHRMDLDKEPALKKLFTTLCQGGGMIMDEYNNHAFQDRWTYDKYASRHRHIREMVHANGGHFTLCPFDLYWINDMIYQGILPLVARGHHAWDPHKGWVPYANYHQFSTRYAGAIWDPKAIVLPGAAERLDWGDATAKLFLPHDYAYLRPREGDRSDLVLHLINPPPDRACTTDDNRVNPPLREIAGTVDLPAGVTVRGVYAATAEPALHQETLAFTQTDGKLTFTVPKLRFWTMVVVEMTGKGVWQ